MPEAATILARIDRIMVELAELRAEVAGTLEAAIPNSNGADDADDLAEPSLIDTTSASARFGYPRCTVTRWCREGDGVKRGGRWLASIPRLQRRLNGG